MKHGCASTIWLVLAIVICPGLTVRAEAQDDANTTVWSGSRVLDREYIVPKGSTLRIEPGTVIETRKGWNARIVVRGQLLAVGTKAKPIEFRPAKPYYWGGIRFEGTESGGRLERCTVIGARRSAVRCDAASPTIRNCRLQSGTYGQGWILCEKGACPLIEGNTITGGGAAAILCRGAAPTVRGNTFEGVTVGVQIFDMVKGAARPTIEDNTHKRCLLAIFDQGANTPERWAERFASELLSRTLALSVVHTDGRDVVTAIAGSDRGATERHRLVVTDRAVTLRTEAIKKKNPGEIPGAAASFKLAGRALALKTIVTGGGLLGTEGCMDTQAGFAVLIEEIAGNVPGRLLWRSPKFQRGALRVVPADIDGDGKAELIVCTGRRCEGKGRIFVYGLAGPAARQASTQPATRPATQPATKAAFVQKVRRLGAQLSDGRFQVTETKVKRYYTGTITSEPVQIIVKNTSSPRPAQPPATQPAATG